jgi:hypothetical protein
MGNYQQGEGMPSEILKDIYSILLTRYQIEAQWFEVGPEQVALLLPLEQDTDPLQLQLFSADAPLRLPQDENTPSTGILYFFCEFSQQLDHLNTSEIARLLSYLNYILPLGSLEISPARSIYFRHGLLTETPWIESRSATDIVLLLHQILPRFKAWITKIFAGSPPVSPELYEELRKDFQDLLVHRIRPLSQRISSAPSTRERLYESRFGMAYFLVGFTAVVGSTLFTPWLGSPIGLSLGLATLIPGFAWVYRNQILARKRANTHKKQAKFDFYFKILDSEQARINSHIQQLENYRDQNDYSLLHMNQTSPESPSQLVRFHQRSKQIVEFQERLLLRSTDLKKRHTDLELSTEHLKLEHQLFLSTVEESQKNDFERNGNSLSPQADTLWPQLLHLASMLNYLEFNTQVIEPNGAQRGALLVDLPWRPQALQITGLNDWIPALPGSEAPHSWMLCFQVSLDLVVPEDKLNQTAELLVHFNRFLPIGTIQLQPQNNEILFKHHFIRLKGDISNFLIIEILEILSFFSQKVSEKLNEFFQGERSLKEVLSDTEAEFISLMN